MTIYGRLNAYDVYKEIRGSIGETAAAHWTERGLLRKMNMAQRSLWMQLVNEPEGDWFLSSSAVTPVASVITLPDDCAKPVYLEQTGDGIEIPIRGSVRDRGLTRGVGYTSYGGVAEAYLSSNTLVVNLDSFTDGCTLYYQQRIKDMHFGTAGASSAATLLHFDTSMAPHYENDYYNDLAVEIQTTGRVADMVDTITDYAAATALATITGTPTSGDYYGTISQLPEEAMELLILMVVTKCLAKVASDVDPSHLNYYRAEKKEAQGVWEDWIARRLDSSRHIRITEDY